MIRELEEKDCAGIADIYNHYIRNSLISFETHEIDSDEILARVKKSRALGLYWLVYEDNDQIIGYTYASQWNARGAYKNTVEVSINLSPDTVGNGRGSMLYSELFKRLHNESLHTAIGCIAYRGRAPARFFPYLCRRFAIGNIFWIVRKVFV